MDKFDLVKHQLNRIEVNLINLQEANKAFQQSLINQGTKPAATKQPVRKPAKSKNSY
jgi:hypothetical protein